ncbi:conserved phage C-terminal domain-containing protein [Burkholderia gladioli]|uniref:conserved phage C-terminal domain-containing protein n=1 Tax=Burkholderia gladioli TaxID=28095 RepID=UPI0016417FA4|nr:conserved phage C-terminal domain-containing protein [Burkholderia gladioli]
MARIRTIKPEFWTSEQVMSLSMPARLLFLGLWNFCDDAGIHPASVIRLKAEVFPGDAIGAEDVRRMFDELLANGLVREYEVDGDRYWIVTGWHHQKIDQPTYKYPRPDGVVPDGAPKRRKQASSEKSSANDSQVLGEQSANVRGENGKCSPPEGKGKEGKEKHMSGKPDFVSPAIVEVLDHLNAKAGRSYQAVVANTRLIEARLREGVTVDQLKAVVDAKVRDWQNDPRMRQYLRPATLFNAEKCGQYVGALGVSSANGATSTLSQYDDLMRGSL